MSSNSTSVKIVDVRTPAEFMAGHVPGSVNIPLQEIPARMEEFRNMSGTVYLCCASGNRSGQAEMYLKAHGIANVQNAGGWQDAMSLVHA
jgi:rhodanese-related sulfurtransferase